MDLGDFSWDILIVFLILLNYWPIDFVSSLEDCFDIFLNVFDNTMDFIFEVGNRLIDESNWPFNFNSLVENVIVALVFFQLQWFVDQLKIIVHFFDLFAIEFLWIYQVLLYLFFLELDLLKETFCHWQETFDFYFATIWALIDWTTVREHIWSRWLLWNCWVL